MKKLLFIVLMIPLLVNAQNRGFLVASTYSPDPKFYIYLHSGQCQDKSMISVRPYTAYLEASKAIEGCWAYNQSSQSVDIYFFGTLQNPNARGESFVLPYAEFNLTTANINSAFNLNVSSNSQSSENSIATIINGLANGLNAGRATANAPMDPALMQQHQSVLNANQLQLMQRRGFTCTPSGSGTYYCRQ